MPLGRLRIAADGYGTFIDFNNDIIYLFAAHGSPNQVRWEQLWKLLSRRATPKLMVLLPTWTRKRLEKCCKSASRRAWSKERTFSTRQSYGNNYYVIVNYFIKPEHTYFFINKYAFSLTIKGMSIIIQKMSSHVFKRVSRICSLII